MAELSLKQIIDRLNAEFTGDTRKLVFWYDDKAEFAEDIESVELEKAKVYLLKKDNTFMTKRFLEREDTATNYLIYAPFPKPDVKENHLEDTLLYSKRFFADRASLLSVDLGIEEKYKPILEKHIKFFASKERTQRFYDLEIENYNEENILVGLLSAICRTRTCSFEEVMRVIITDGTLEDNKFLAEMEKYDLLGSFWKLCEQPFGYTDAKPTLEKLIVTMFVTSTSRQLGGDAPQPWKTFVSYKSGNIIAFLDNLMNSVLYSGRFDELSKRVSDGLNVMKVFAGMQPEDLVDVDTFLVADQILVKWIVERLSAEDTGAKLDRLSIPELCEKRMKMHFGSRTAKMYKLLLSACHMIIAANYNCLDGFNKIIKQYLDKDYQIDQEYRRFYYNYDQIEDTGAFESLRTLVENIYTNEFVAKILPKWNKGIKEDEAFQVISLQRNFYNKHVRNAKERTVVIISDALRYEVGQELFKRMMDDPKCSRGKSGMIGVFRLESQMLPGNGKFDRTGLGADRECREASNTAFNFLKANGNRISGAISTTININHSVVYYSELDGPTRKSVLHVSLPKTDAGIRIIPMLDEVLEAFQKEYDYQQEVGFNSTVIDGMSGFIFTNKDGNVQNPQTINHTIKRVVHNYNSEEVIRAKREHRPPVILPDFSCHHLRHTFCTRLCERETNLKVIQSIMGHADIRTTMDIYAEVTEQKKKESIGELSKKYSLF